MPPLERGTHDVAHTVSILESCVESKTLRPKIVVPFSDEGAMAKIKTIHFLGGQTKAYHSREVVCSAGTDTENARLGLAQVVDVMLIYGVTIATPDAPTI